MMKLTTAPIVRAPRLLSPLAVLLCATALLAACGSDPTVRTTTTEQTTTRQVVPVTVPATTTTITKTQQYIP